MGHPAPGALAGGPGLPIPMPRNRGETLRLRSGQAMAGGPLLAPFEGWDFRAQEA
jgi:hypothetical protein